MTANYTLGLMGSVFTLVLLYEMLRRRRLREKYAVFWATVAVFTIVVALFPATLSWAAQLVGVTVPANLLFFVASMLLLTVGIHHSYELGRLEERTRTLAEEVGLLRMDIESRSMADLREPAVFTAGHEKGVPAVGSSDLQHGHDRPVIARSRLECFGDSRFTMVSDLDTSPHK